MFNNRVSIERDNKIADLEASIFDKIKTITEPNVPPKEISNNITSVSFEEAIKELLTIQQQTK